MGSGMTEEVEKALDRRAIAKRLRIGLEPIETSVHHLHRMVAEHDTVVTEHTEDWHFGGGERVSLPFVSIHVIRNGRIRLWRDYWNLATLLDAAPKWWVERVLSHSEADFA